MYVVFLAQHGRVLSFLRNISLSEIEILVVPGSGKVMAANR
jgi:hypothetical protein